MLFKVEALPLEIGVIRKIEFYIFVDKLCIWHIYRIIYISIGTRTRTRTPPPLYHRLLFNVETLSLELNVIDEIEFDINLVIVESINQLGMFCFIKIIEEIKLHDIKLT